MTDTKPSTDIRSLLPEPVTVKAGLTTAVGG